jgi:hypothetical protein
MNAMVRAHQDMVDLMQTRANEDRIGDDRGQVEPERGDNPTDTALNQFAARALPAVRRHLDEARRVRDALDERSTRR